MPLRTALLSGYDILKTIPEHARAGSESMKGLRFCDELFTLERNFAKLSHDDRFEARQKHSQPIMEKFFEWAKNSTALPKMPIGEAITYAQNQRVYLEHVLLDGRLELSNNRAERSVKPFVLGRKNWLFADTVNGANASAVLYSIIESAKENGLHPFDYLEYVFRTAPALDSHNDPTALNCLLPWNAPPECRFDQNKAVTPA